MNLGENLEKFAGFISRSLGLESEDELIDLDPRDFDGGYEPEYGTVGNTATARYPETSSYTKPRDRETTNVAKLPGYKGHEVRIIEPRSFGDTTQIVKQLLDQKTVVLNLHLLDKEQSQRTIDFVCGAAYALSGSPQKVGDTVFVFTPNSVQLSVESKENNAFGGTDSLWGGNL